MDCRGLHLAAGEVVPVAKLNGDQIDDLLTNGFADPHFPDSAPAPADADGKTEAAEAPAETEGAALTSKPNRRRNRVASPQS